MNSTTSVTSVAPTITMVPLISLGVSIVVITVASLISLVTTVISQVVFVGVSNVYLYFLVSVLFLVQEQPDDPRHHLLHTRQHPQPERVIERIHGISYVGDGEGVP